MIVSVAVRVMMFPFSWMLFPLGQFDPILTLAAIILWILYFTVFEGVSGRTIGKKIIGIKVVDESEIETVDMMRAFIRNILRIVDFLPVFYIIGLIFIATSPRRQRFGDIAAKSIVVKA